MSNVIDQSTNEDTPKNNVAVIIDDIDTGLTCASNLTATSSNTTLVPNASITIGGTYPNCTISMNPAANANGNTTITLTVSDGSLSAQDTFVLTVNAVNDLPELNGLQALWTFDSNDATDDSNHGHNGVSLNGVLFG